MNKICPADKNILARNQEPDFIYYSCQKCCGIWIPGTSLHEVFKQKNFPESLQNNPSHLGTRTCPKDGQKLNVISYKGVELDICEKCDGLWLDKGELEKISKKIKKEAHIREPNSEKNKKSWPHQMVDGGDFISGVFEFLLSGFH